jgi:hypothetical protein
MLSGMDAKWAPYTYNVLDATTKRPKTARYAVARRRFQADWGRVQADREGGVRLHRMTGGHGKRERDKGQDDQPMSFGEVLGRGHAPT